MNKADKILLSVLILHSSEGDTIHKPPGSERSSGEKERRKRRTENDDQNFFI